MITFEAKIDDGLTKAYFTVDDVYYEIDITMLAEHNIQEALLIAVDNFRAQQSDEKILKIRESIETNQWVAAQEDIQDF